MIELTWADEPWVKQYIRDTPAWKAMPWEARGLFQLLWGKVDRAGVLVLDGLQPHEAVAVELCDAGAADRIKPHLDRLTTGGWVVVQDGRLVIPHFLAAQEAKASTNARVQRHRARAKALGQAVTFDDETPGDAGEQDAAPGNATMPPVTQRYAAVTTRSEEKRRDKRETHAGAHALVTLDAVTATWNRVTDCHGQRDADMEALCDKLDALLRDKGSDQPPQAFVDAVITAYARLICAWERKGFTPRVGPLGLIVALSTVQRIMAGKLDPDAEPPPRAGGRPAAPAPPRVPEFVSALPSQPAPPPAEFYALLRRRIGGDSPTAATAG